jgi:hypothetical protein
MRSSLPAGHALSTFFTSGKCASKEGIIYTRLETWRGRERGGKLDAQYYEDLI